MSLVALSCSNCKGEIQLDDSKEFGFCLYCGTKIMVQDDIQRIEISGKVKIDSSETFENCLNLANEAYIANNYLEAYNYYTRVLEINNNDYKAVYRKALCAGYLSDSQSPRNDEIINGLKKAFNTIADDSETASGIYSELVAFASKFFPKSRIFTGTFENLNACTSYTSSLYNSIILLDGINLLINAEDEANKKKFISHLILLCEGITKNSSFRYGDGVQFDKKGRPTPKYSTYKINSDIINKVNDIRKSAVESHNNLASIQEGIKAIQVDIDKYNSDIAKYKAKVSEVWQANPGAHNEYKKTGILLMALGIFCCMTVLFIPLGIVLFSKRKDKLNAISGSVFPAELYEESLQSKETNKKLALKKKELTKYRAANLKK